MMFMEEKCHCHFYSFTSLLRLTTHFSSTKITNINPDATRRDIDALFAVDKKKKTVNVSKVGRVNEFPYQIRAASCHESLLLSLSSINTTYSRSARRLANNTKTAMRRNLTRGHSFMYTEAHFGKKKSREMEKIHSRSRNVRVFNWYRKGENNEIKHCIYSHCASRAKCGCQFFTLTLNTHFSR